MCQLFAVDMAYCGGEGLVTDKDSALVVMACSPVRICHACLLTSRHTCLAIVAYVYPDQGQRHKHCKGFCGLGA